MGDPIAIGIVRKPFGVHGQCYVGSFGQTLSMLVDRVPFSIQIGVDVSKAQKLLITELRESPKGFTVRFDGVTDMNAAEKLREAMLFWDEAELPKLKNGHYYSYELVGLTVIAEEDSQVLGTVIDVESYPTVDCLDIRRTNGETFLVSMTPDIMKKVDKQAGCIIVSRFAIDELLV